MRRYFTLLLLLFVSQSVALCQSLALPRPSRAATVLVRPVLLNGDLLPHSAWMDNFIDGAGRNWHDHFDLNTGIGTAIPYGTYRFEASYSTLPSSGGMVDIHQDEVLLVVGFGAEPIEGTDLRIEVRGTIEGPTGTNSESWCKIMSVYGYDQYQSLLRSGAFNFGEVTPGEYVLVCVSGPKLLFTTQIRVHGGAKMFHFKAP